jgi:hypothetical protein
VLASSTRSFIRLIAVAAIGIVPFSICTGAPILAPCNAAFTVCGIPENVSLQLPFVAIAGDAVLIDPGTVTVSDVCRIFNNLINTGLGTGLGDIAFLYSADDATLPSPSTYSANVVFIQENPTGVTSFVSNGTDYLLGVPEPRDLGLLIVAGSFMLPLLKRRTAFARGK